MKTLWCDLKTNQEKADFLRSGRAVETGIIAPAIVEDIARAFEELIRTNREQLYLKKVILEIVR